MFHELLDLKRPLINYDLETTGVNKKTDRIVQFAMEVHKPDGTIQAYKTLVNPGMPIPKGASDVHGITDEIISLGCAKCWQTREGHPNSECPEFKLIPTFGHIAPRLYDGFRDADIAGYNIMFDRDVLLEEFLRVGITWDTSKIAVIDGFRMWQVIQPRTLTDALEHFVARKLEGAHDAMNDVRAAGAVIQAQLRIGRDLARPFPRDPQALHERLWPQDPNWIDPAGKFIFIDGVACFNFGANKGKPVKTNIGMLKWMLRNDFSKETLAVAQSMLNGAIPMPPAPAGNPTDSI